MLEPNQLEFQQGGMMRRTAMLFVLYTISLLVFCAGCDRNEPPATPQLVGPTTGNVGDALTFTFSTTDPDNQEMEYMIAWGDSNAVEWSALYPSGQQVTRTHVFVDSGVYHVKVKARDSQLAESEWSEPAVVSIWEEPPANPVVSYEVISTGAYLRLSWFAVNNAKSYEVKVDDSVYMTTSLNFDVAVPTATIEVRSVRAGSKSDPATINCGVVESTIDVYGDLDITHSGGFGFTTNGQAETCRILPRDFPRMDFYADGKSVGGEMRLASSRWLNDNRKGNGIQATSGSYDEAELAVLPGAYSDSSLAIVGNGTYYLRISADTTGTWSTADNFAKANVVLIDGYKVTLKTAYQRIGGLRWLKPY